MVTTALNAVFAATPIGWLVLGIMALIAAGVLLYKNWDKVKNFFEHLWENPQAAIFRFTSAIKEYFQGAIDWVKEKWQAFSDFLSKPIFGRFEISGSKAQPAANAAGGIYGRGAFLTTFAEDSGESAIPHTPNRRNISLLARTNDIMGNPLGGGINATFAPVINISGTADTQQINQLMTDKMHEFEAMLKRVAADRRRLSYA